MILTKKQEQGLNIAVQRFKDKEKYTIISGYAGSGKSELIRHIISALAEYGVDPEKDVVYTAFTGKACTVLREKGNTNVLTLCKLLYDYKPTPNGKFVRVAKKSIPYKIVVVDEVSMAPNALMVQLAKHQCYVICLGDPGQLPPVSAKDDNHLLDKPHIFLDEIMRQAQESEIIRLSMNVRAGKPLGKYLGKEVRIYNRHELSQGMLNWADQVLVATNKTRQTLNQQIRTSLGRQGAPKKGDKIIFLRNYWDLMSDTDVPIVNGTIGYLQNPFDTGFRVPYWAGSEGFVNFMISDVVSTNNDTFKGLDLDSTMLQTGQPCLEWKTSYNLHKQHKINFPEPLEVAYGYAITVHKSQGSSWGKVLVIEETFPTSREEHKKWLYTAITRAEDKLVLIK